MAGVFEIARAGLGSEVDFSYLAASSAMSGSQMTPLLARVNAPDPGEGLTKWRRMAQALGDCQRQHGVGNHVVQFIKAAMEPVRFIGEPHRFEDLRADVNRVLAFAGYRLGPDGKVRQAEVVTNLADAEQRAGRLRAELSRRRARRHGPGRRTRRRRAGEAEDDVVEAEFTEER